MKIVVFGYGNPSRGDDAIGPLLLRRIEGHFAHVQCYEDFQLQIEHALDLQGFDLALFIDAGTQTQAPFGFYQIAPVDDIYHTSHALAPQSVLGVYAKITGQKPPPSFILCVAGASFGLGEFLSQAGQANLEAAWEFLQKILPHADISIWQDQINTAKTMEK